MTLSSDIYEAHAASKLPPSQLLSMPLMSRFSMTDVGIDCALLCNTRNIYIRDKIKLFKLRLLKD